MEISVVRFQGNIDEKFDKKLVKQKFIQTHKNVEKNSKKMIEEICDVGFQEGYAIQA